MQAGWHVIHNPQEQNETDVILPFGGTWKIHINPKSAQSIRAELDTVWNIRPATIYGDVNKIAEAIRHELNSWKIKFDPD